QGLSHGIWAFAVNPKEVSCQMIKATQNLINYLSSTDFATIADLAVPELKKLATEFRYKDLKQTGVLMGTIIGKYGVDYLLLRGSGKLLQLYRELREANAAFTLHTISKSVKNVERIKKVSDQWWKKTSPIIEEIKRSEGKLGQNLHKAFKNENLSEVQVRKIL